MTWWRGLAHVGDCVGQPRGQHLVVSGAHRLDRSDAQRLCRAYNADGDFAPVGDEQRPDGHRALRPRCRKVAGRAITGSSFSTWKATRRPASAASTCVKVFITSMSPTMSPTATLSPSPLKGG